MAPVAQRATAEPTYASSSVYYLVLAIIGLAVFSGIAYIAVSVFNKFTKSKISFVFSHVSLEHPFFGMCTRNVTKSRINEINKEDDIESKIPLSADWALPHLHKFRSIEEHLVPLPILKLSNAASDNTVANISAECDVTESDISESFVSALEDANIPKQDFVDEEDSEIDITDVLNEYYLDVGDLIAAFPMPPPRPALPSKQDTIATAVPAIVVVECEDLSPFSFLTAEPSLSCEAIVMSLSVMNLHADHLEVPPMSWNAPRSSSPSALSDISNISGRKFTLGAPLRPKRSQSTTAPLIIRKANKEGFRRAVSRGRKGKENAPLGTISE